MANEAGKVPHLDRPDEKTACFVHSLIAGEWVDPSAHTRDGQDRVDGGHDEFLIGPGVEENDVIVTDTGDERTRTAQTVVHSRHLTKKQLSDMAWNVRKLSKKLDSIKLKLSVKNVFLVTKAGDETVIGHTREIARWFLSSARDTQYNVYVEERLESEPEFAASKLLQEEPSAEGRLKYWDAGYAHEHAHLFDFVITLGGDGTVLYTSWLFQHVVPPVLSFSLGSLGFLTKFDFNHHQKTLETALKDGVAVSLRLRFECTIMRSNPLPQGSGTGKRDMVEELIGEETDGTLTHKPDKVVQILNDVVLDRGPNASMSTSSLPECPRWRD